MIEFFFSNRTKWGLIWKRTGGLTARSTYNGFDCAEVTFSAQCEFSSWICCQIIAQWEWITGSWNWGQKLGWLYIWEQTPGGYEANAYKLCLGIEELKILLVHEQGSSIYLMEMLIRAQINFGGSEMETGDSSGKQMIYYLQFKDSNSLLPYLLILMYYLLIFVMWYYKEHTSQTSILHVYMLSTLALYLRVPKE